MNDVDEQLLQLMQRLPLGDPRPELLAAVHRRVARRRAVRYAAAATAAVLVAAGTAGAVLAASPASQPATVRVAGPSSAVVPWVDQPATPPSPAAPPTPPPPAYPACTAAQLAGSSAPGGAAAGNLLSVVVLTNTSRTPCSLSGYPTSLVGVHADGTRTTLSPMRGNGMFDDQFSWPANLRPGQSGRLGIATSDGCGPAQTPGALTDPATSYPAELVGLPGGGTVRATATFNAVCGVGVTTFGTPPPPAPPAGAYPDLQAKASLPSTAVAGATLRYTVTLTNTGSHPLSLTPCPVYTEGLYTTVADAHSYRLNCSTVHAIAAGDSVTYAMRIPVPANYTGAAKFGWSIPNSASAFTGTVIAITSGQSSSAAAPPCTATLLAQAAMADPRLAGHIEFAPAHRCAGDWAWARLADKTNPSAGQQAYFHYTGGRWALVSLPTIDHPGTGVPASVQAKLIK